MIDFKAMEGTNYTKEPLATYIENLHLDGWSLENLGESSDSNYDVYGMRQTDIKIGKPWIMIRSSVHGNEWLSAYWCKDFARFLGNPILAPANLTHFFQQLKENYNWYWIPIHNPWGYINNVRVNINGVNLNDDLGAMSQKENVILVDLFNELKPVCVIDNHSFLYEFTPCHAMSIYEDGKYTRSMCREVLLNALDNIQRSTGGLMYEYNLSGHDPTKFRAWSARQRSSSGLNCMSWLIETDERAESAIQIKQGLNAVFVFCLYFDMWYRKNIQNPVNSDFY